MKNKISIMTATILVLVTIGAHSVLAQTPPSSIFPTNPVNQPLGPDGGEGSSNPTSRIFQIVTCKGVDDPRTDIKESECNFEQLLKMFSRIIKLVLYLLVPIILGMILFVGYSFLTAGGDSGKLTRAKGMVKPLLIGIFLIFAAWFIVYTILDKLLVDNVSGVPKSQIIPAGATR